jgi:NADPH-dependent glutamate synthase beta subunit-like oxidoreductase
MFIDARTLPEDKVIETDVCIIGSGPAGTTLAHEFSFNREKPRAIISLATG